MNRREFLARAGVTALSLAGWRLVAAPDPGKPRHGRPLNILYIMTDQQRFDALGAHGNKLIHTPNLDRLCKEGVRFTNTYVAQALCSPSRASIFSGLYPHTHRVQENIYGIEDATSMPEYRLDVTWPLLLQRAGYHTGYIGKWHLGEKGPKCFDEWFGFNSGASHWMGQKYKSRYRPDWETDLGIEFLERNKGVPFLLCQSYYPPHTPYTAPKEYWKYYEGTGLDPMEYYAAISNIDMNVGRLLKKLEELRLLDSTLVIFTSDHGDAFGKRPGGGNKRSAYDEAARVPLIMRLPGIFEGGHVLTGLVSNVDIMPTVLQITGIEVPPGLHGRSLTSLVQGKDKWREAVCIENREDLEGESDRSKNANSRGVRTKASKLILRDKLSIRAKALRELYDLSTDPGEHTDIYGQKRADIIMPILGWLESWSKETSDEVGLKLVQECRRDLSGVS